jgi:exosortase/archaeosortase family protein
MLQNITADLSVWFLRLAAVPVFREGLYLSTPVGHFEVAVACSGLRFLITSLAIGTLFAHLTYQALWRQLLFMVALVLFSIFANGMRAFLLIYIAEQTDMAYGFGDDHYIYGWLVFGLVLLVMFWLGGKFSDMPAQGEHTAVTPTEIPAETAVDNRTDNQTYAKIAAQGFSKAQCAYLLLIFAGFMMWRLSLPLASVPQTPSAALNLPDATAVTDSDWGIHFVASQKQSLIKTTDGFEFYRAEYAHRQQQGELVSWSNKLFKDKHWTIVAQQPWSAPQLDAEMLLLKDLTGNSRTLVYWYQIGDQSAVSSWKIKLAQTLALLSGSSQYGRLNAVSINAELKADDARLLKAVERLQQLETPHD